jgi:hypothetical protein
VKRHAVRHAFGIGEFKREVVASRQVNFTQWHLDDVVLNAIEKAENEFALGKVFAPADTVEEFVGGVEPSYELNGMISFARREHVHDELDQHVIIFGIGFDDDEGEGGVVDHGSVAAEQAAIAVQEVHEHQRGDALVAVREWVVLDDELMQVCGFGFNARIRRLAECGLVETAKVAGEPGVAFHAEECAGFAAGDEVFLYRGDGVAQMTRNHRLVTCEETRPLIEAKPSSFEIQPHLGGLRKSQSRSRYEFLGSFFMRSPVADFAFLPSQQILQVAAMAPEQH